MSQLMVQTKKQSVDGGFSLVELIIVVSILAIASIPLMKSMGLASRTNSKAQSIQNATSLGERVMEEVKSSDLDALVTAHGGFNAAGICSYVHSLKSATQGEEFDVTVTIDKSKYSTTLPAAPAKSDKVKAANILALPKIEDIDTLGQAVISSQKELNRYDTAAQNYFNEKKADYTPLNPAVISSKTIDIVKENATGPYPGVTVNATVTYVDSALNKFVRDLYTGTFVAVNKNGSTTEYKPLNSNIYIFYKKSPIAETIKITDTSGYRNPLDSTSPDSHRVFFIRQEVDATDTGPELILNGTSFKYTDVGTLDADGHKDFGDIWFMTNLDKDDISDEGKIYTTENRTRVYDITVELSKGGTVYSSLNSTVTASDEVP